MDLHKADLFSRAAQCWIRNISMIFVLRTLRRGRHDYRTNIGLTSMMIRERVWSELSSWNRMRAREWPRQKCEISASKTPASPPPLGLRADKVTHSASTNHPEHHFLMPDRTTTDARYDALYDVEH
jgi:hypothetical protein